MALSAREGGDTMIYNMYIGYLGLGGDWNRRVAGSGKPTLMEFRSFVAVSSDKSCACASVFAFPMWTPHIPEVCAVKCRAYDSSLIGREGTRPRNGIAGRKA